RQGLAIRWRCGARCRPGTPGRRRPRRDRGRRAPASLAGDGPVRAKSGGLVFRGWRMRGGAELAVMEVAEELLEAADHLGHGLLLGGRDLAVDAQDAVDLGTADRRPLPFGSLAAACAADRLRALVDDLEGVVEIVEIAFQSRQDLLQGVERGLLLAGLVGREHRLGDPGGIGDLILALGLALSQPAQGPAEALKDGHARNV